jgi:hypothetical protein
MKMSSQATGTGQVTEGKQEIKQENVFRKLNTAIKERANRDPSQTKGYFFAKLKKPSSVS